MRNKPHITMYILSALALSGIAFAEDAADSHNDVDKSHAVPMPTTTDEHASQDLTVRIHPARISSTASDIIALRLVGVDLLGLSDIPRTTIPLPDYDLEIVRITSSHLISDSFNYTIYLDHRTEQYWIYRTGGLANVRDLYGPAPFPPQKNTVSNQTMEPTGDTRAGDLD